MKKQKKHKKKAHKNMDLGPDQTKRMKKTKIGSNGKPSKLLHTIPYFTKKLRTRAKKLPTDSALGVGIKHQTRDRYHKQNILDAASISMGEPVVSTSSMIATPSYIFLYILSLLSSLNRLERHLCRTIIEV